MEIKLNEEDFERLASTLERRITAKVVGLAMQGPAGTALIEGAKDLAAAYLNDMTVRLAAIESIENTIKQGGIQMLRGEIDSAVAKVLEANDCTIEKVIAERIYEKIMRHAHLVRDSISEG